MPGKDVLVSELRQIIELQKKEILRLREQQSSAENTVAKCVFSYYLYIMIFYISGRFLSVLFLSAHVVSHLWESSERFMALFLRWLYRMEVERNEIYKTLVVDYELALERKVLFHNEEMKVCIMYMILC